MNDFEKKIFDVIARSKGVKGAEIANNLGVDKKLVNSTLSNSAALKAVVKQQSDFRWYLRVEDQADQKNGTGSTPEPDDDLRRLCSYYLQCISLESSSSVSQFLYSKYDYRYAVLNKLGIDADKDTDAIALLKRIHADKGKKAYLGYPVSIFTIYGKGGVPYKKIAPVFLFPVDYSSGAIEVTWIPAINMEVIKGYYGGNGDSLADELVNLETELGINNPDYDAEAEELVLRLHEIRDWKWKEKIDPYQIPKGEDLTAFLDGIYNRVILIEAEKASYTDGLESELMILSKMPTDIYRETALYAWVKDQVRGAQSNDSGKPLLEVLSLNTEQANAVETALESDLTIVTGPPGTGKSQVVTDLLANIAWNGKSALFSSRNNKAVDVVDKRVNELSTRPCLLRIGGTQHAARLAEIVEGFLNSSATLQDQSDLKSLQQQYDDLVTREQTLKKQREKIVQNRNALDEMEKRYCTVRSIIGDALYGIDEKDRGKISASASTYRLTAERAVKQNNGFFSRLFWGHIGPKRIADRNAAEERYAYYANRYGLTQIDSKHSGENVNAVALSAKAFEDAIPIALDYRNRLKAAQETTSLEKLDRELLSVKKERGRMAQKLWDSWLRSNRASFSAMERKEMMNYVSMMKLTNSAGLEDVPVDRKQYSSMVQLMTKYLRCWAVTSLSARGRIPFEAGLFDYVIIDEASQCDIASIIPLLFRAKRAVIIGDPKQLQHISQLSAKQDAALLNKYDVAPMWSYSVNSLYSLAAAKVQPEQIIQLRDHFRSCADIIEYSNETFYDGSLRTATDYSQLKIPPGEKPGIRWMNVLGKTVRPNTGSAFNQEEVDSVVSELKRLIQIGYTGSIGVTTPFHLQAEKIEQALANDPALLSELVQKHGFLADTVHKFQGDERDLMIFSSVVTKNAARGTIGFLSTTGNLFNVAVTRARSILVVVGDYKYCAECEIDFLRKFAYYYMKLAKGQVSEDKPEMKEYTREYPSVPNHAVVSDWEKVLYTALFDAGIKTIPQYPADRYSLDLALLLPDNRRLDIEVDGEMYHKSWNKELSYRDQLRNQRLFELGWDVKRFWVCQVRDELNWCVKQIKKWIQMSD